MCHRNIYSLVRMENREQFLCGNIQSQVPRTHLHSKYCCRRTDSLPHGNLCNQRDLTVMTAPLPHLMMPVAVTNHLMLPSVVGYFFARQ